MVTTNFHLAPPVRVVDGLTAVPIDIQQLDATVILDAATRRIQADATFQFVMGGTAGCPMFDLRQTIQEAYLNGAAIPPINLAQHDFGGGPDAQLRIVNSSLPASSTNTLRLLYEITQPQSPSSQPIAWEGTSTRVYWDFWFSDLWPARYLEMWFPSNLIYDQFLFRLDLQLVNSGFEHVLITNGSVTKLAQNHWRVEFPSRFTSLSSMLLLAAADRIDTHHGTMTLPSGTTLNLDTYKLQNTVANLLTVENDTKSYISTNIANLGPYIHGDRFTTWVWTGSRSMEYEGGVTTSTSALEHEIFHSWFARGIKPASQNDSWLDEGWTSYNTNANRFQILPFDLAALPVTLCSSNPFNRITPGDAYSKGFRFFAGLAAAMGLANLRTWMAEFYQENPTRLYTTGEVEAFLISKSGLIQIADYFERFVYGFGTQPLGVDLYIRDASDDPGIDSYTGSVFWNSPDLWIRNSDDNGTLHQNPEYGQDNWFYACVRNRGTNTARTFVVTFNVKTWAGTQFTYPGDFLPCIAATVGLNLPPGESRVVKARWPKGMVPAPGTHACWLASVYCPSDKSPAGRHVWEHNNLAQKNLVIVNVHPDSLVLLPVQIGSLTQPTSEIYRIEIRRPLQWSRLAVSLEHHDPELVRKLYRSTEALSSQQQSSGSFLGQELRLIEPARIEISARGIKFEPIQLRLGASSSLDIDEIPVLTTLPHEKSDFYNRQADLIMQRDGTASINFRSGLLAGFPMLIQPRTPLNMRLRISVPPEAKSGDVIELDLVQQNNQQQVIGGVTFHLNVT
jgi:hypothetical protein